MRPEWKLPILTGLIGVLVGIGIGWMLYHPDQQLERYLPQVVLQSGAVALERKPDLPPPVPIKKATKELGGKLVRAGTVIVKPEVVEGSLPSCSCKDINLDFGIVDQDDGQRTVFHTDNATIIGGTDSPQVPYTKKNEPNWEVGVLVPIDNPKGIGPSIARRIGPFHVGIAAAKTKQGNWTGFATATLSF